jgi:hypothetical protein
MKKLSFLLVFIGFFAFSQNQESAQLNLDINSAKNNFKTKPLFEPIVFNDSFLSKNNQKFAVLKSYGNLSENYILVSNVYYKTNTIEQNSFLTLRKDAFNPSGTTSFYGAIGLGFFNLLFQKN